MMRHMPFAAATLVIVLGPLAPVPVAQAPQGAVAAAPTRAAAGVAVAPDYVIGADDVLSIMFWRDKDLSAPEVVVRPDGMVTLPELDAIADRLARAERVYVVGCGTASYAAQVFAREGDASRAAAWGSIIEALRTNTALGWPVGLT